MKKEVLRERNITTLSDAILAAERADAVERFAKFGVHVGIVRKARDSGPVPMEIDFVHGKK